MNLSLSRKQTKAIARSTATINIWVGAVRSSKTHGSLWDFVRFMARRASGDAPTDGVVLLVGVSTNTVWRNLIQPLVANEAFSTIAPFMNYRRSAPSGTLFGQEFAVVGAGNESSWLSIQGMTVAYCLGDEAVAWPKSFWDMLVTRLSLPHSKALITCNPGSAKHHLKQLIDSSDPDVHVETFLLEDNPTLTSEYIDRTKRMYSGLFYQRMILAMWVSAEGSVFETWDPDMMVTERVSGQVLAVGIDYGTNHPSAAYALTTHPGGVQLSHEWSPQLTASGGRTRMTDTELADSFEGFLASLPNQPKFVYADPAAASFREELKRRGIVTHRADNSVVDGIRTIEALLTDGTLTIARQCPALIEEIPEYRWDPKATEKGRDEPIKENDDHVDAARYAIRSSRHLWGKHVKALQLTKTR